VYDVQPVMRTTYVLMVLALYILSQTIAGRACKRRSSGPNQWHLSFYGFAPKARSAAAILVDSVVFKRSPFVREFTGIGRFGSIRGRLSVNLNRFKSMSYKLDFGTAYRGRQRMFDGDKPRQTSVIASLSQTHST